MEAIKMSPLVDPFLGWPAFVPGVGGGVPPAPSHHYLLSDKECEEVRQHLSTKA